MHLSQRTLAPQSGLRDSRADSFNLDEMDESLLDSADLMQEFIADFIDDPVPDVPSLSSTVLAGACTPWVHLSCAGTARTTRALRAALAL